jgi:hypothetical protein
MSGLVGFRVKREADVSVGIDRRRSEAGDTLIEVLIALVVLGIASVAMILAFATSINGSANHRSLATFDTVLKTAADEVTSQLQQQSNALWGTCSGASPSTTFTGLPSGYTAQVTSVQYWNGTSFMPSGTSATWSGSSYTPCTAYAPQLVKIAVTYRGQTISISAVITDPWSAPLPNTAGPAAQLAFLNQPGNGVAGSPLSTQPVVAIENAAGNPISNDAATVTLSITSGTGTSGATLSNCIGTPFLGVVTFSNCGITTAGSGYKLTANDASEALSATSTAFNVTAGPAAQLAVTTQPGNGTGGSNLSTQPVITVEDAYGNVVTTDTSSVALSIGTNPAGGTLTCTTNPVSASSGVATFAGCKIDKAGNGYTLTATDGPLTSATSNTFNVTVGPASQLAFTTQPSNGTGGSTLSTQPVVTVQDAGGNTVTSSSASITLAINSGTGTLACTTNPRNASSGVATFSGCKITLGTQGTFTLKASASGLTTATSTSFTVAGTPTKVAFTSQPGNGSSGSAFIAQPVVAVEDSSGDVVTTNTTAITLAINTGTGTLACTTNPLSASSGIASFAGCKITLGTPGSFTLKASASALTTATSSAFTVAGTATKVVFTTQPGNGTGGSALSTQPVASIEDSAGDIVTSSSASITLAVGSNPGGGTLTCNANPVAAVNGVAAFAGCAIDKAGTGYTLIASASGQASATSATFNVTVGPATQLTFTTEPGNGVAGLALSPQPVVAVQDAGGNTVTSDTSAVSLTMGNNPGSGALNCPSSPATASAGVATFVGCKIDKVGVGYTLIATDGTLILEASTPFNITPGAPTQLIITTQPGNGTGGLALSTQPVVTVEDAYANTVTSDASAVLLTIGSNPSGGTLTCSANPLAASGGVASFAGCAIDRAGNGYTLTATDGSLSSASSTPFNITVGPASQVTFITQPGNGTGGLALSTQPVVAVQDAGGNTVTTDTSAVALAIASNPSGGTLTCGVNPVTASGGIATFTGCSIDKAGAGYSLMAVDGALASETSTTFNITVGPASQVDLTTEPGNGTGGSPLSTQPVVAVQDAGGNTVTTDTSAVTLTIGTNPSGGTLTCTTNPRNAVAGVATFAGCSIDKAGTGYTLTASDGALASDPSTTFNITVGPASQVVITTQPGNGTGGSNLSTQPVVTVQDAGGNTVTTDTSAVTLSIGSNPSGGSLTCTTNPRNAVAGVATFAGCKIDKAGNGYTLTATDGALTSATSAAFNVTVGPAAKLAFSTQPGNGSGGSALSTQPVVAVQDAGGNTVTGNTSAVTLAIGTNPGGGTLICTPNPVTASSGVATFAGCKIDKAGNGYTLTATDGALTSATSATFNIVPGAPTQLVVTMQPPPSSIAGVNFGTAVAVEDAVGNIVTSSSASVTLTIGSNPGGGTLTCTTDPANASSGVATFSCSINKTGAGYTLAASSVGLSSATTNAFAITPGTASLLAVTTQPPASATAGVNFTTAVSVQDSLGNVVTSSSASVTLAIGTNPGGGSLTCTTNPVNASSGVATFSCSINKAGSGYTLTALSSGLTSATTNGFTINAAAPNKFVITSAPVSGPASWSVAIGPITVQEQDTFGNPTTTAETVNLASNSVGLHAFAATSGGATVTSVTIPGGSSSTNFFYGDARAGTPTITASGLLPSATQIVTITPASPSQLLVSTQPGNGTGGSALSTQPVVTVQDTFGNTVVTDTSAVALAIGTNPSGGTLSCTTNPVNASSGVATFAGCKIDKAGNGYTLTASDGALTSATSATFNVTVGAAAQLAFTTQPGNGTGGSALSTQPVVTVQDAGGNTVTGNASAVTLAIGTNPSGGTLSCTTNPRNAVAGIDAFAGCKIDKAGNGYTLTATDGALTSATSSTFNVTLGTATKVIFTTQPGNGTGGSALSTQPVVAVQDAGGNTVTTDTSAVTLAIGTNPSGGTLTCTTDPLAAVSGVATFAGCKIDKAGNGYTLTATDGALTSATSSTFNVTLGTAAKVIFTTQPGNGTGGSALSTQPVVTVQDAGGNTVTTDTSAVTLAIGTNPSGGTLTCTTNPRNAVAGIATFAGCKIDKAGNGFTLTATDGALSLATSSTFNVTVGAAAQLAFTTQPGNGTGGSALTTQPVVAVQDAGGNTVTGNTSAVTLAIGTNPSGGTLTCTTNPVNASSGVATFAGCKIDKTGIGYTLTASDGALTSATSSNFNVTSGPPAKVVVTTQPGNGTGGSALSTQPVVTVEDVGGNTVVTDSSTVTLAIGTNPAGGTLSCTTNPLTAVSGVATFAGCKIDKAGNGYTLTATDGALTSATSTSFNVTVGAAAKVTFTTQPGNGTGGSALSTQPVVTVQDAGGNTVTTDTSAVTLAIGTNPSGGTLTCTTNPVTAVSGVATFAGCKIDKAGNGYTLTANDGALTSATSAAFNVTVGAAAKLAFTATPGASTTATAFVTQPVVAVQDAGGNTVTSSSASVTLAINTGSGTLLCTTNPVTAVSGVATFAGCKITVTTQGSFTLKANATGLTQATSASFTVAGTATKLAFTTSPGASTTATTFGTQPVVAVEDSSGDVVTTNTASVTLAINTGSGTLLCTTNPVTAVSGVATFAGCKITVTTQGSFTLKANATGLTQATSASFTVAGTATQLVFTTQPAGAVAGVAFTTQPVVTVEDSSGDVVTTSTASVTLAIGSNFGGGTLSCTGANPMAAVSGVATFVGCSLSVSGFYTLTATASGLTGATSSFLQVN